MSIINSLGIEKLCVLGISLLLAACSTGPTFPYSPRVAVMGDDSDITSLPRSSGAFRAVATAVSRSFVNEGFLVVDEQAIASNLGFHIDGRRSKTELLETIKLMNASPTAANHAQVAVVYTLTSSFTDAGFGGKVSVMVYGELYDLQSNQFIDSFALPRKTFPAPANCNRLCQEDIVRENARDIASGVGGGLAKQLRRQVSTDAGYRQNQTSAVRSTVIHSGLSGLISMYTLTFKHIPPVLVNDYMRDLEGRCAGHVTFDLLYTNPAIKRYSYSSKANTDSVYRCLARAIDDRGLRTGEDVLISQTGSELIVEKITIVRPNSSQRFN